VFLAWAIEDSAETLPDRDTDDGVDLVVKRRRVRVHDHASGTESLRDRQEQHGRLHDERGPDREEQVATGGGVPRHSGHLG
jgi:hypothetical protein